MSESPADESALGITWGVRASFLAYINGLRDGAIRLSDGATLTDDGRIHFPFVAVQQTDDDSERWIRTQGAVRFEGHFGMLSVPLTNPAIRVTPEGATLCSQQSDGSVYPIAEIALAEPEMSEAGVRWPAAPVVLSEPGSRYFDGYYPEGTDMDPITISLPPLA